MLLSELLSVLLEEDAFLLAFLQSFVDFRNGQRQGVGDVAPACGSLQVAPIIHPPFVVPQEGIIDLDSPDPDRRFRRERDTTRLDFMANLLCVVHVLLPLLVNDDYLPCPFLSSAVPCMYLMEPFNEMMLNYIVLETCYIGSTASWQPAVQALACWSDNSSRAHANQGLKWDVKGKVLVVPHPISEWHDASVANIYVVRSP